MPIDEVGRQNDVAPMWHHFTLAKTLSTSSSLLANTKVQDQIHMVFSVNKDYFVYPILTGMITYEYTMYYICSLVLQFMFYLSLF